MKAPAHITGGIFFTGFFCSLWNINIFSNILFFVAVCLGSILPDIDHTRSWIGKFFYPLAKWLDKRFGHRTVTHSFLFLISVTVICRITEYYFNSGNSDFTVILFFSVLSHLLLDMATLHGVPLFYPFKRYPCVIPGNPDMRIETGNLQSEIISVLVFSALSFTFYDLFNNGFWTQYNRIFGTVRHVYSEFRSSPNFIEVEYYMYQNAEKQDGKALLLFANETDLILYESGKLLEISTKNQFQRIEKVKPLRSDYPFIESRQVFVNITSDSLNRLLSQNLITGEVQSNEIFSITENNIRRNTKTAKFEKNFSPVIFTLSELDTLATSKHNQLLIKRLRLQEIESSFNVKLRAYNDLQKKERQLMTSLNDNNLSLYQRNRNEQELIRLRTSLRTATPPDRGERLVLLEEIRILENEINTEKEHQYFSGYISYPSIPEQYKSPNNQINETYNTFTSFVAPD
jgi:inner membrane protein